MARNSSIVTKVYASSVSLGRRARVVQERDNHRFGSRSNSRWTIVPLPTPPGPERTTIPAFGSVLAQLLEEPLALLPPEALPPPRLADADLLHQPPGLDLAESRKRLQH